MAQSGIDLEITPALYAVICISWATSTIMGLIIHFNKELHVHPLQLYKLVFLLDSAFLWSLMIQPYVCDLNLQRVLQKSFGLFSVYWEGDLGIYKAIYLLDLASTLLSCIYWYISLVINGIIAMDIVYIIGKPFGGYGEYGDASKEKYTVTIVYTLVFIHQAFTITRSTMTFSDDKTLDESEGNLWVFGFITFWIGFTIIYVNCIIKKVNFGDDIKKTIKKRYFINLLGWLAFNMFIPVSAIYMLSNHNNDNLEKNAGIKYSLVTMQFVFYS